MARWEANTRRRLQDAAMELFTRQGFAATTTAEIAAAAGLTQRTFFRYFKDKQEVLFGDTALFQGLLVQCVLEAPEALSAIAAARTGLATLCREIEPRREQLSRRERIIANSPELQEREAAKVRVLSSAFSDTLTKRATTSAEAEIIAQTMLCLFGTVYRQWIDARSKGTLEVLFVTSYENLRQMLKENAG